MKHSYDDVETAEFDLTEKKKAYLRERGWKSNGSYPGGLVLWNHLTHGFRGVGLELAVRLQSHKDYDDIA